MKVIITAGPTREYIDPVRFITNASSGRMGFAVAAEAIRAGHEVTLLAGPVYLAAPAGCRVVPFVSVADLKSALHKLFGNCDALVMAAAVGDFRVDRPVGQKLSRCGGPITLNLTPTEDLTAGLGRLKTPGQRIVAFAVEDGPPERIEAKARTEMKEKNADFVVVNTLAAMAADASLAAILSATETLLPWAHRTKQELAGHIVRLMGSL